MQTVVAYLIVTQGCMHCPPLALSLPLYSICRYHYNVSTQRLDTHITVGRQDSLVITAIAAYNELWLVVMDADPRVKDQRHIVTDNGHLRGARPSETYATELLPREWISQLWDRGYFITALAGA